MPDLFKRTMLKICEGFEKQSEKKNWKILGGWGGSTIDPLERKFQGGGGGLN